MVGLCKLEVHVSQGNLSHCRFSKPRAVHTTLHASHYLNLQRRICECFVFCAPTDRLSVQSSCNWGFISCLRLRVLLYSLTGAGFEPITSGMEALATRPRCPQIIRFGGTQYALVVHNAARWFTI